MADNKLPDDYPERDNLAKGGLTTREMVRSASNDDLVKRAGISTDGIKTVREYETAHPETSGQPASSQSSVAGGAGASGAAAGKKSAATTALSAAATAEQTERLSFVEPYMYKGVTYGPGENVEVPKGLADSMRKRNLVGEGGRVLSQSPVGATLAQVPTFVAPDQNFANEQLAAGFPGRELLISKNVTTRSELMRMSDVDLLNVGATRELIGQIREALRMTQPVR